MTTENTDSPPAAASGGGGPDTDALTSIKRRNRTFSLEMRRATTNGILEAGVTTFFLLIAVQYFEFGPARKALIVISSPLGLLLSPLVISFTKSLGWTAAAAASRISWLGALCLLFSALFGTDWAFVIGVVLGVMSVTSTMPLLTQIYQENYSSAERGDLFSKAVILRYFCSLIFSWLGGMWLDAALGQFRGMLLVFAVAAALGAWWMGKFPSTRLRGSVSLRPWSGLRYVRNDKVFRWVLASWMLMGFGNLIVMPLRVELLANPVFGIDASPLFVAVAVSIVPGATTLLFARMWGRLFDRMNFFLLRIFLNLCFFFGILLFFLCSGSAWILGGSFLMGMGMAGGNIAWSLWVTKIAKPDLVAEYMGVHTFLTGIRGVIAPFLGFYLALSIPMGWIAAGSAILILLGCVLLLPEAKSIRRRRPGEPVEPRPGGIPE